MADYNYYNYPYSSQPGLSLHLCFFLAVVFMFVGITWYINYGHILEGIIEQIKLVLMVSPLLLLLVLHLLSCLGMSLFSIPLQRRQDSYQRSGGTPWGVGLFLVILIFMLSYQSDLRERLFPLLTKWSLQLCKSSRESWWWQKIRQSADQDSHGDRRQSADHHAWFNLLFTYVFYLSFMVG